ncbi:RelA/SpoT family protein [Breznakiella homolactica]|uniref:Bifunctional (P)ppGpp synthetase/guanosine-3',5'-bis(Diphosphate) 3'-pyrophosphohydrolase n=1 Tax=Breznakiella homolactica TaxID=2798577 RepID=A0A7T7XQJ8_9SPIR|nr:bifunctional (p)ppGpp synthetase/guanosine-3',5'-bis(diphosphate) 3'-pyrophosphohydrolase [Breznakiella homolactica]QQO10661.1 bifunctional (p)ppGpp synthetase/guanosine-3',5'-bis(diphosphate) 3'-pyrophosphohydrolase [Breznakiella homolactica]
MEKYISDFTAKIEPYPPEERDRILRAARWAEEIHAGQKRASGEPYIIHPLGVASILIDLHLDSDAVTAALLHGVLDNTGTTKEAIAERFGDTAALLVEGVSEIADISAKNKTIQEAENIRKMLFAMVKDIRVILIKLADKLHNMRTLDHLPPEQRKQRAQECLDIYAPLADRLGISWLKDELEDLSLKQLNREAYLQIKEIVSLKRDERNQFLEKVQDAIRGEAAVSNIPIEVKSRAKHFYSIYKKMRKRNKNAGDLYDLFGIRILCDSIENCYTLLGIVHRLWKPIDGRFKDYIAMPKANGYQSLHTTVMSYDGKLLEIQIRTFEMERTAEYGVASHWLYKKGSTSEIVRPEDLSIVNRLKTWNLSEQEPDNSAGFLEDIKREILKDSIYVFTPQGKVIELPAGATPIDFAYYIHSDIGEHCMGAKVNGAIVPLSSELRNTQVVEILTAPSAHPNLNWLRAVKTSKARSKIRSWLVQHDDSLIIEKNVVAKKKPPLPSAEPQHAAPEAKPAELIQQRVINEQVLDAQVLHVKVEDEKNMMIRFARCCHPVTGDPIIGYVSRGRGIIIHRENCSNLKNIPDFAERKIYVEWENATSLLVKRFKVEARMATDLFSEIEGAVRKHQGHLIEGRLEESGSNHLTGFFTMQLEKQNDLKLILKNIRSIPSVFSIQTLA